MYSSLRMKWEFEDTRKDFKNDHLSGVRGGGNLA
jgi:hypothetical protein